MEITADQVEQAVTQFYADPTGKSELNSWLTQVQQSTHAWNFAWTLLNQTKSQEVQFFAGNTIYYKVSRYWTEVPKEDHEQLKLRILNSIVEYSNSKVVLQRLVKALGAYILHTIEEEWPTALENIISMFNPENVTGIEPSTALDLLFNILTIIPDELETCQDTMGIRNSNKNAIKDILKNNSSVVLRLIQHVIQANQVSNITKELVLKTLTAWLQLPISLQDSKDLLISLIPYSNYGLLCEGVLECIRTAITDSNSLSVPNTVMEFIEQLLSLKSVLDEALHADDENTASLIYSLFTSVVETHSGTLLKAALEESKRSTVIQVVSLLVDCSATPGQYPTQETLSSIPFAVWYTIQDDILYFNAEEMAILKTLFKPVYLKLVVTFIEKSLQPPEGTLSSEEKEMFRCYRQDICDTYMYAHHVLKGDMLNCLEQHLRDGVMRIQKDPNDWRYLEAVLHAYSSVAETVAESDDYYVPRFIQSIPHIPFSDNMHLISVALTTLGAYADWLNFHHDHLQHVVPLMVAGLVNKNLVGAASQALRDLTLECPVTIAPFSQPILQSCQKVLLHAPRVDSAETERIVTIFSRVLSVGVDQQAIMTYLNTTLTPYINRITELKDNLGKYSTTADEKKELVSYLKLLGCLARHLNLENDLGEENEEETERRRAMLADIKPQPLLLVLQPLMPILADVAKKGAEEPEIVEALCKMLKNSVTTLKEDCLPLLPALLEIVPDLYQKSLHYCVLEVIQQLAILFGREEGQTRNMAMLIQLIVETTLSRASNDLWSHTDAVQGFLVLMTAVVRKVHILIPANHVAPCIIFAIEALKLPEEHTVRGSAYFLSSIVVHSCDQKGVQFREIVKHNINHLVRTICFCICASPRQNLVPISDILVVLGRCCPDDLVKSLHLIQSEQHFPSPRITTQQKEDFTKKILKCKGNKKRILDAVTDLALISRGVAGTEYGAQTTRGFRQ